MALKQPAISPTLSLVAQIQLASVQTSQRETVGLFCKITSATEVQLGGTQEGRGGGHKSLRRTLNNKGMSRSVRQGLVLAAEEDVQRFRRLINLAAAGKRLYGFYSGTPQAPPPSTPLPPSALFQPPPPGPPAGSSTST